MLAGELGCQLMEISPTNLAGAPVAPVRRVRNHRIAQAFFRQAPAVILFDECEEILGQVHARYSGDDEARVPRKSYLNQVLETNDVPTVWIANYIRGFEPSYLRRFSLCFEMTMPHHEQRQKMLASAFDGAIGTRVAERIARHQDATPALLVQAANAVATLSAHQTVAERDAVALRVVNGTLKAQGKAEITQANPFGLHGDVFQPSWIHASVNLDALSASVHVTRSARLCLYGPPGTGKTAFGRWLAKSLQAPHLVLKASDLLSPYVGETEQNMARAFETAREQKAVLQFDEVDSFLQDRQKASKAWEITQVNEMLTQMEGFEGVFIASTNLFQDLDEASLRRFDLAVSFSYLKTEAAWEMFTQACAELGVPLDESLRSRLATLPHLTPGDFDQLLRRARLLRPGHANEVLHHLEAAVTLKKTGGSRPIGFVSGGQA
jgi:SpoVK/Ycf46/Vps4 family AAA+-type ATPase